MAELTSRTLWSLPGVLEELMEKVGAKVIAIPPVRASEVITTGVVNGHIGLDPGDVSTFKLFPFTKSMTRFKNNIYASGFSLVMNKGVWQSLSETDQAAISSVSGEQFARMAAGYWQDASESALAKFSHNGVAVIDADTTFEAELKKASLSMTRAWIEKANQQGIDAREAYDFYIKTTNALSK